MGDRYTAHTIPGREARELLRRMIGAAGEVVIEAIGAIVLRDVTGTSPADALRDVWSRLPTVLASDAGWAWVEAMCVHASTADGRRITLDRYDEVFAGRPWEALDVALEVATANGFFRPPAFSALIGRSAGQ